MGTIFFEFVIAASELFGIRQIAQAFRQAQVTETSLALLLLKAMSLQITRGNIFFAWNGESALYVTGLFNG